MNLHKDSIKKVLFLDIDGVLNRAEFGMDLYEDTYRDYCLALHRPSVNALKVLLADEPSLKIVWISDWAKKSAKLHTAENCHLNPLKALEQFEWMSNRVVGSIFSGPFENAQGNDKMLAIEKFVEDNCVESFAILDDDVYTVDSFAFSHLVAIDPLKSFLEDDIQTVCCKLKILVVEKTIYSTLMQLDYASTFTVNGRYECAAYSSMHGPMFAEFEKDNNCPQVSSTANVLVYDNTTKQVLKGIVSLCIDTVAGRKTAFLYTKHAEDANWTSSCPIITVAIDN